MILLFETCLATALEERSTDKSKKLNVNLAVKVEANYHEIRQIWLEVIIVLIMAHFYIKVGPNLNANICFVYLVSSEY